MTEPSTDSDSKKRPWAFWAVPGVMVAGVAVIAVTMPPPFAVGDARQSGNSARVSISLQRGNQHIDATHGAQVQAGDSLRFEIDAPTRGFVAAFLVSEDLASTWVLPKGGHELSAVAITAGPFEFPNSARLDGRVLTRAFVLFSREPFNPVALGRAITARLRAGLELGDEQRLPESVVWSATYRP